VAIKEQGQFKTSYTEGVWLIRERSIYSILGKLINKSLCYEFPILNGLKQGDALQPLLFTFASVHAIRNLKEYEEGLELYTKPSN
jgi:hypothetical protein